MSSFQFFGGIEIGLIYALVAIGVFITFRILDFPDLTVDGSFPMGAAIAGILIVSGINPWLASSIAFIGGCGAGLITAYLNVRCKILHLLASILTMTALYSINLRIMGRPNLSVSNDETVFTVFENTIGLPYFGSPLYGALVLAMIVVAVFGFLEVGLGMRATGANPRMARAQGIYTSRMILLGVSLSNGLIAFAGALFAQSQGFADVGFGPGTIIIALASVIIGEVILPSRKLWVMIIGCILGSIVYFLFRAVALNSSTLGLQASDLSLVTAILVGLAMIMPQLKLSLKGSFKRRSKDD
jgi:putative ABC transport system permease protein